MTKSDVRLVNDGTALMSMRESDFDAYSAYGEVIDNSLQAGARAVRIAFETETIERGYELITEVRFGDDGDGMDTDTLHRCLQLGYSSRYNDRSGIGRFGVGMTLAAINQCMRIEVFSKTKVGKWRTTWIDLQDIQSGRSEGSIPEPVETSLPATYAKLLGDQSGTVVVWKKYDRQPESFSKILEQVRVWIGRTYRYFIWDGIDIYVNGELINAIDPLYSRTDRTSFPDDPKAQEFDPIVIPYPVPRDARENDDETSNIGVRVSLLPEQFRPQQGSGSTQAVRDRHIDMNEGISIVRNRREVFYGIVPYWPWRGKDAFAEIDRWWGCEINFDAVLDRAFTVKNIKRGAVPESELKKTIADKIRQTRSYCLDQVRQVWRTAESEKRERERVDPLSTGHDNAEQVAKDTPTDSPARGRELDAADEATKLVDRIKADRSEEEKARWISKWSGQPFTVEEGNWRGPVFMEVIPLGGSEVIRYNRSHAFFEEVYRVMDELPELDPRAAAETLKTMIDLLLIAHAKAESKFEPSVEFTAEELIEQLRMGWSMYLQSYLRTWKKENDSK